MSNIPEPVKRIVRQEAGFGCCKCGIPIIEYHHIVKESQKPEDIMLLCPIHHHEATVNAMLKDEQQALKTHPYNIQRGIVEGTLKINQETPVVTVGNNQFIGDGHFLVVDGDNLLSLEIVEGQLSLSMRIYNQQDILVAEIMRNEWISGNPLPWDLQASFQLLKIRRKQRDINLEIDSQTYPINIRANLWKNSQIFQIDPNGISFGGTDRISGGIRNVCFVGIRLNLNTLERKWSIGPYLPYGKGSMVSNRNIRERVREGLQIWKKMSCTHEFELIINKKWYSVSKCNKCGKINKIWK